MKLFTVLLGLISQLLNIWKEHKVKQDVLEDVQEKVDANVAKAEAAVATPDPVRDERLRSRFDRSRAGQ